VLDEVGMTDDPDLVRVLAHVEAAGAKVILVGDHRQLGAVGPGGALEALVDRHRDQVQVLYENLRQADPAEARALIALRAGDVEDAVSWYRSQGRIVAAPSRDEAMERAVNAWAEDVAAGRETALFAWRRTNVEELNRIARAHMAEAGELHGPELVAPGGRPYRAGDRVVTLAPGANRAVVTSERGIVEAVEVDRQRLVLRTEDERRVALAGEEISAERLAHGYAVTAHRSQGQTTERAHLYLDGGGRELAYVAMSRAKESSHAYLVADSLDQAAEDLVRDWSAERRMRWASDLGTPEDRPNVDLEAGRPDPNRVRQAAIARALMSATLEARRAVVPADLTLEIVDINRRLRQARQLRSDLAEGRGAWADTEAGRAARELTEARRRAAQSSWMAESAGGWQERRHHRKEAAAWIDRQAEALGRWKVHGAPEAGRLDGLLAEGEEAAQELMRRREHRVESRDELHARRSGASRMVGEFERDIDSFRDHLDAIERPPVGRSQAEGNFLRPRRRLDDNHDHGIWRDLGHGLGR
jgi:hypothetical protein